MAKASWIGQTIGGRYQIEQLLGQGGMSAVYRAQDPNLRRIVAIKLIHTHLSDDPSFVRRFMEEAATVAQLRHPNIIQVYDFDHDEDVYYIVFEFIPGESLHARLDRLVSSGRKISFEEAIRITATVADALDYAHRRNLVHRDVKPANVMINIQEEPILMDFGIVKIVGGTQHTATGATIGTARYMAPEQVRSENIDARTDLYSLGVVLFEMLAGRPPYMADSAMTMMMMHISDPVPDLTEFRPETPRALREIVAKALAKNPAQRFQSGAELAAALRAVDLSNPNQTLGLGLTAAAAAAAATVVEPLPGTYERPAPAGARPLPQGQPVRSAAGPGAAAAGMGAAQPGVAQPPPRPATAPPPEKSNRTPLYLIGGGVALVLMLLVCVVGVMALYPTLVGGGEEGPNATGTAIAAAQTQVSGTATALSGDLSTAEAIAEATLAAGGDPAAAATATSIAATATAASQLATQSAEALATQEAGGNATVAATPTEAAAATEPPATQAPTATNEPTIAPSPTTEPTLAPTEPPPPTDTPQPEGEQVRITGITLEGGVYYVSFETFNYTPALPGMHVHFFFDTVPPEQAGVPGGGPWILYGGPSPFTQYTEADRPAGAGQMCALVANPNHSVIQGTGNCWALP